MEPIAPWIDEDGMRRCTRKCPQQKGTTVGGAEYTLCCDCDDGDPGRNADICAVYYYRLSRAAEAMKAICGGEK